MQQIDKTSRRAGFWIFRAEDDARQMRVQNRACAHGARLERHVQRTLPQPASRRASGRPRRWPPALRGPGAVFPFSRRLRPRPTMRSSSVITHPTGTSPSAAASRASRSASRIIASSNSVHTPPRQELFYHTRKWKIRQHPLCGAFLGKTGFLLAFNRRTRYTEYIRQRRCKEWMEERITTV